MNTKSYFSTQIKIKVKVEDKKNCKTERVIQNESKSFSSHADN